MNSNAEEVITTIVDIFTNQGDALMCQTHGAVYEPDTGLCTRGPCVGASLFPLEVTEEDGVLWFEGE